jgi:hypothetical protein
MNCGNESSCCVYDTLRRPDGSIVIWCDCSADGEQPTCCHSQLVTYPREPRRSARPIARGVCISSCIDEPWQTVCRFSSSAGTFPRTSTSKLEYRASCSD